MLSEERTLWKVIKVKIQQTQRTLLGSEEGKSYYNIINRTMYLENEITYEHTVCVL